MRFFESLLILFQILVFASFFTQRARLQAGWFWILLPLILLSQVVMEGARWQMIPAYVFSVLLLLILYLRTKPGADDLPLRRPWLWSLFGLLAVLLTSLPLLAFPIPQIPSPSGAYPVGSATFHFVDHQREESYGAVPGGQRQIMVQLWYPRNADTRGAPMPYYLQSEIVYPALAATLDLPPFLLSHLRYVRIPVLENAPLSEAEVDYPLLIFSHGWSGTRVQNTFQMIELASHGFVVAALDHPFGAAVTVYPDGRIAYVNPQALPEGVSEEQYERAARQIGDTWAADIRFLIDQLEALNDGAAGGSFTGRLDLNRLGVFGHSTGGGAAVLACAHDARCKAGLVMDAWLQPVADEVITAGVEQPFLFMNSEAWSGGENSQRLAQLIGNSTGPAYGLQIRGSGHFDFSDLPLFSPLATALGLKGPIDGRRVIAIINHYSVDFFDQQLKGNPSQLLLSVPARFPEVQFDILTP